MGRYRWGVFAGAVRRTMINPGIRNLSDSCGKYPCRQMRSRFAARWSPAVWIITIAVLGVIVGVEVLLVRLTYTASGDNVTKALLIMAMLLPVGMFGIVALLAPWSYAVRSDAIVVNRLGPAVVLRFEQIREIQRIDSARDRLCLADFRLRRLPGLVRLVLQPKSRCFPCLCYEPAGSRSGHNERCNEGRDLPVPGGCLSSGRAKQQTTA